MIQTDDSEGMAGSSFRDPSGFVFSRDGVIFRQVNSLYKAEYDHLMSSGLYNSLVDEGLLIPHEESDPSYAHSRDAYQIIRPQRVPFISYPYEWCFSELRDAALLTLRIQKKALDYGMSLKDCNAFNIQFVQGRPILMDTSSFELYRDGYPWVAYRQFCQHFIAPLALMAHTDIRLNQLSRLFIDGIPMDLTTTLLPIRARLNFRLFFHITAHSICQRYFAKRVIPGRTLRERMTRPALVFLIETLESVVNKLRWKPHRSDWTGYYDDTAYAPESLTHKHELVSEYLNILQPRTLWDLGANTGLFSRLAGAKGIPTVSMDADASCVEVSYLKVKRNRELNILPLVVDLTNPSPSIGWANQERMSLMQRGPADTVLALALIHHLAIGNNVPFNRIALFLRKLAPTLIIEFVPKSDVRVQRLLATREDIFSQYTQSSFQCEFAKYFVIQRSDRLTQSERVLFLMREIK